jgi:chromate transporter
MDSTEITLRRTGWRRDGELHLALEAGLMSRSDVHAELAEVVAGRKPGRRPVVITATFVGFVVGGLSGAVAATAGIFLPAVLFTLAAAPLLRRHGQRPRLRGFVRGVTVAVVGVLAGTTPLVARSVLVDAPTRALAAASLAALLVPRRIPEPVLVLAGALAGFVLRAGA